MRQIEPPMPGQVFAGTGGMRKVVSVKKRSDRMNDYNIEWQRPDNDWRSTVMWLPYWDRWVRTAKLVSSNVELSGGAQDHGQSADSALSARTQGSASG